MTRPTLMIGGAPWDGAWPDAPTIHHYRADYPPRYVVARGQTGWNECERCWREHRVWMCDDAVWARLPRSWRSARVCVTCFRVLAPPSMPSAA